MIFPFWKERIEGLKDPLLIDGFSTCFSICTSRYLQDVLFVSWGVLVLVCVTDYAWYLLLSVMGGAFSVFLNTAIDEIFVLLGVDPGLCGISGVGVGGTSLFELEEYDEGHAGCCGQGGGGGAG